MYTEQEINITKLGIILDALKNNNALLNSNLQDYKQKLDVLYYNPKPIAAGNVKEIPEPTPNCVIDEINEQIKQTNEMLNEFLRANQKFNEIV